MVKLHLQLEVILFIIKCKTSVLASDQIFILRKNEQIKQNVLKGAK